MKKTILTFVVGIALVFSVVNQIKSTYAVENIIEEIASEATDEPVIQNKIFKVSSATSGKNNPVCIVCREGESISPEQLKKYDRDVLVCYVASENNGSMEDALEDFVDRFISKPAYAEERAN